MPIGQGTRSNTNLGGLGRPNLFDTNIKATSIDLDLFSDQTEITSPAAGDLVLVLDVSETPDKIKYITRTNFIGEGLVSISNNTDNYVTTATGSTLNGEANLQFDGSTLTVTGAIVVGSDGSGQDVTFHSDTSSDNLLWDSSEEQLKITGTDGTIALEIADGDVKIVDKLYFYDAGGEYMSSDGSTLTVVGSVTFSDAATDIDIASHDGSNGLKLAGTLVTTTAAELNIMDGGTAASTPTLVDADRVVVNDDGTMKQVALTTLNTYFESEIDALSSLATVGTITSGTWEGTTVAVDQGGTGATSLSNLITLGTHTTGDYVGTITGGTGVDSTAATSGEGTTHTLSVDLNEVGEVAIADGDYIPFMDATDSSATKKEALHDVATLFAGTGLTATSSVIAVDAAQSGITSVGTLTGLTVSGKETLDIAATTYTPSATDGILSHAEGGVTMTDSATSGSATTAAAHLYSFELATLAATNASVTTTDASTVYISGPPAAGSQMTLTRAHALWVDSGNVRFDGSIYTGTTHAMNSSGLLQVTNQSNIAGVGTITSGTWQGTTVALNQGGTGATTATAAFDALSPMTAEGDILYGGSSGTVTKLAKGSDDEVLTLASGIPSWAAAASGVSLSGSTNNTIATVTGSNALAGEANLTFDGTGILQIGASADIEPRLDLLNDENSAQIGIANATDDMVTGSADGDLVINSVGDHNVIIAQADTKAITLDTDGDVTFANNIDGGTWLGTAIGSQYGGTGQNFSSSTGAISVSSGTMSAGTLAVGVGGTGATALTDNTVLTGTGSSAITAEANLTYDGTDLAAVSSSDGKPVLTLKTTHTTKTSSSELQFLKDAADTEDGEQLGQITFYGEDEGNNNTQFAEIVASISESDEGDEAGILEFKVAESDSTNTAITTGLKLEGEHATDGEIDVTIGAGAASTTTIAGTLTMGSTAAMDNDGLLSVVNQSSITGLGTVSSGTWEATDVAVVHGGTGASSAGDARTNLGLGTAAVAATGISNTNVPVFTSGVADDDFLRVDGTSIEGRSASEVLSDIGGQASLTFGISNTNAVKIDAADVADDEYARFTANGLESRTAAEVAADIEGSIDAVGTIASGTWEGTDVGVAHGGTGVSTLLSNAILTGNGATDIQAEADLLFSSNKLIPTASAHDAAGTTLTMSAGATTAGTTNNIAGGALTFQGGQGKGSGAGGDIVFQTANAAGSGSSLNALATALTISDNLNSTFANDILLGSDSAVLSLGADADATLTHDGTTGLTIAANPFEVDSGGNITLDSHTGIWIFQDANTEMLRITESGSGDITIKLETDAKDLIFTDNNDDEGFRILDGAAGVNVAGDITMAADKSIKLPQGANVKFTDAITQDSIDDHDAQGIIMTFTAGSTITPFSPVYLHTDDEVHECNADAIATMPCIGVSVNTSNVTDGNPVEVMMLGLIRDESFTDFGTNGAPVYVSTTVGTMTNTAPSGEDEVVQVIGHSVGEKLLFVQPCLTTIEHAA